MNLVLEHYHSGGSIEYPRGIALMVLKLKREFWAACLNVHVPGIKTIAGEWL